MRGGVGRAGAAVVAVPAARRPDEALAGRTRDTALCLTSAGTGLTQVGGAFLLLAHQPSALLLPLSALNGI
jgi:hypothetical protein